MESKDKVELIEVALKQLMDERDRENEKNKNKILSLADQSFAAVDEDHQRLLLTRLLNQLERADGKLEQPESSTNSEEEVHSSTAAGQSSNKVDNNGSSNSETEEIIKELKNVKRQNLITHCLLSVMIVLTVAWQLSEVSLILKFKEGIRHPFRSFGGMISGILKGPNLDDRDVKKLSSAKQKVIDALEGSSSLPGIKMPHIEFPGLDYDED